MLDLLLINGLDFINTSIPSPYIGHYILEKILKENGIDVKQINVDAERKAGRLHLSEDPDTMLNELADVIIAQKPKIAGFYTICNSFITVVQISMRLHDRAPDIKIIYGGPHATITAKECLRDLEFLKLVCLGESEYSITPVIQALLNELPLDNVPGIAYRKDGEIVSNPCCALVSADQLADYTVIDYGEGFRSASVPHTMEGGRGCPFGCSFCSTSMFWQRTFRVKPVDTLLEEMDKCHETLGSVSFAIEHDMFTANRKHITEFCNKLIQRGSPYYWKCSSRVDVLDEELIELMAKAGCFAVFLGIETGSERMQKTVHKNLDLANAAQLTKCLLKNKYKVTASFIYGFPDETEDDFIQTVQLMEQLLIAGVDNLQFHPFMLLPGTEETAKVKDRAIFNERDVDISIYNRKVINEESRELIRKYKDIFIQYYSFSSVVKSKYPWFEIIFVLASFQWNFFKNTFKALAKNIGLLNIYLKYEPIFKDVYFQFNELDYSDELPYLTRDSLQKIVMSEDNDEINEVFRYENDLFDFAVKNKEESKIVNYRLDIDIKKDLCVYSPEGRSYVIKRNENTKISVFPVPEWMKT